MRKLFNDTYPMIENRLIAYVWKRLQQRGFKGDRKAEAKRIVQTAVSRDYEECTPELCMKYGADKGNSPEECMREGLITFLFIKAQNEVASFFKPKPKKDPPVRPLESFIATLPDSMETLDTLSDEDKLKLIRTFLPPPVLQLFEQLATGISYRRLAQDRKTTVGALTQNIHRWRKKIKRYLNNQSYPLPTKLALNLTKCGSQPTHPNN